MASTTYKISDTLLIEIENNDESLLGAAKENNYQAITLEKLKQFGKASGIIQNQDLELVAETLNENFEEIDSIINNVYVDMTRKNWSELFLTLYSKNIKSSTLEFLSEFIELINAKNLIFETPTLIRIHW